MNTSSDEARHPQTDREPAVQLSAEEREALRRVKKQEARKRESAFRRFGKNPPQFFWWWCSGW